MSMRYFFIICFLLICYGCGSNVNSVKSLSKKYCSEDFWWIATGSPASNDERNEILYDLHKAFSEQNKNMAFELYKKSSGDEKVKYLLIYLAFNKQCMKVWEHQRINSIILENINDEKILKFIDYFHLNSFYIQEKDEILLENISLLCQNRLDSSNFKDLIDYRYDLKNMESIILKISNSSLALAEKQTKQYISDAQEDEQIEIDYYKKLYVMLNQEIRKRLEYKEK